MSILITIIIIIILIILLLLGYYFYTINKEPDFSDINDDCRYKRFGCCKDKLTPRQDQDGTNCRGF
jgi:flagellar basal body-associated protein FliL